MSNPQTHLAIVNNPAQWTVSPHPLKDDSIVHTRTALHVPFTGSQRRFGPVEPSRTRVKELYIPCYLCEDVVREGSMMLEPPQTGAYCTLHTLYPLKRCTQVPYTPCSHCEDEVREGSVQSNHSELTSKTSTHLSFSALKWFEKVCRGLNHSETVYRYATHLVPTVKMRFEKVRYSRTTPNSRQRLLHTFFSLH